MRCISYDTYRFCSTSRIAHHSVSVRITPIQSCIAVSRYDTTHLGNLTQVGQIGSGRGQLTRNPDPLRFKKKEQRDARYIREEQKQIFANHNLIFHKLKHKTHLKSRFLPGKKKIDQALIYWLFQKNKGGEILVHKGGAILSDSQSNS